MRPLRIETLESRSLLAADAFEFSPDHARDHASNYQNNHQDNHPADRRDPRRDAAEQRVAGGTERFNHHGGNLRLEEAESRDRGSHPDDRLNHDRPRRDPIGTPSRIDFRQSPNSPKTTLPGTTSPEPPVTNVPPAIASTVESSRRDAPSFNLQTRTVSTTERSSPRLPTVISIRDETPSRIEPSPPTRDTAVIDARADGPTDRDGNTGAGVEVIRDTVLADFAATDSTSPSDWISMAGRNHAVELDAVDDFYSDVDLPPFFDKSNRSNRNSDVASDATNIDQVDDAIELLHSYRRVPDETKFSPWRMSDADLRSLQNILDSSERTNTKSMEATSIGNLMRTWVAGRGDVVALDAVTIPVAMPAPSEAWVQIGLDSSIALHNAFANYLDGSASPSISHAVERVWMSLDPANHQSHQPVGNSKPGPIARVGLFVASTTAIIISISHSRRRDKLGLTSPLDTDPTPPKVDLKFK